MLEELKKKKKKMKCLFILVNMQGQRMQINVLSAHVHLDCFKSNAARQQKTI